MPQKQKTVAFSQIFYGMFGKDHLKYKIIFKILFTYQTVILRYLRHKSNKTSCIWYICVKYELCYPCYIGIINQHYEIAIKLVSPFLW